MVLNVGLSFTQTYSIYHKRPILLLSQHEASHLTYELIEQDKFSIEEQ